MRMVRLVFVANAGESEQRIVPLNEKQAINMLAKLDPAGKTGEERLKAQFTVDDRRQLRVTVYDVKTKKELLIDVPVVTLR